MEESVLICSIVVLTAGADTGTYLNGKMPGIKQ